MPIMSMCFYQKSMGIWVFYTCIIIVGSFVVITWFKCHSIHQTYAFALNLIDNGYDVIIRNTQNRIQAVDFDRCCLFFSSFIRICNNMLRFILVNFLTDLFMSHALRWRSKSQNIRLLPLTTQARVMSRWHQAFMFGK